ncbi:MAG: UDP-N-acetylglucosamine 2-epimerase (non-hydrolyzing) [Candidatus Diapherotrites archaeon]
MKRISIVFGTRPEIIKLAELMVLAKEKLGGNARIIHTGQHYSFELSSSFIEELGLPQIDRNLEVGSMGSAKQLAETIERLDEELEEFRPEIVLAEGDTNSVLAAAIAANKNGIPFGHIEAGLRSFDRSMPEELNRIAADQFADYCFAPTKTAQKNLLDSAVARERIFLTGNTIVEAVERNLGIAEKKSKALDEFGLEKEGFVFFTAHRAEIVDKKERLAGLLEGLKGVMQPVLWPMHPRTEKNIESFGLGKKLGEINDLVVTKPLSYFDCLKLCASSKFIVSDSGGLQEEASIYKKPILVTRENTERPEIIGSFGTLVGWNAKKIASESRKINQGYGKLKRKLAATKTPFGDGKASQRILKISLGEKIGRF